MCKQAGSSGCEEGGGGVTCSSVEPARALERCALGFWGLGFGVWGLGFGGWGFSFAVRVYIASAPLCCGLLLVVRCVAIGGHCTCELHELCDGSHGGGQEALLLCVGVGGVVVVAAREEADGARAMQARWGVQFF